MPASNEGISASGAALATWLNLRLRSLIPLRILTPLLFKAFTKFANGVSCASCTAASCTASLPTVLCGVTVCPPPSPIAFKARITPTSAGVGAAPSAVTPSGAVTAGFSSATAATAGSAAVCATSACSAAACNFASCSAICCQEGWSRSNL